MAKTNATARSIVMAANARSGLELLESRALLSSFVYQDLNHFLDPVDPLYVLLPTGENAPARTIGSSVAAIGDVNGDGRPDILVGAGGVVPGNSDSDRASAAIFSGATGERLFTFSDGFSEFGSSVAGIGDVNGDGTPDVAMGSPRFDTDMQGQSRQIGRVSIYSGADGTLIRAFDGEHTGDRFGAAVASAGDFDGDHTPDLIVGAPGADAGGNDRGRAYIFSGLNGQLLATLSGQGDDDAFGYAVANAGDLDNDGLNEVIVGAPGPVSGGGNHPAGHAYLFNGGSHSLRGTLDGFQARDRFGFSVAGAGDVNNDGVPDLVVGAPSADNDLNSGHIEQAGLVVVYSGVDGQVLLTLGGSSAHSNFGASIAGIGDINADGHDDLLIAASSADANSGVGIYSGADGRLITRFTSGERDLNGSDRLSSSVAAIGDVDGDGFTDFAFTGSQDANPGRNDRARVYVFSGVSAAALHATGSNDSGAVWGTSGGENFLVLDGQLFKLAGHDGFTSGDQVADVNSQGTVVGTGLDGNSFVWSGGTRTPLSQLINVEMGGPAGTYTDTHAVDITDSGLILVRRTRDGFTPTTWLLDHGTLTYLMDGVPVAMNESRAVIATMPSVTMTMLWTPQGGVMNIAGIYGADINENGVIVGTATDTGAPQSIRSFAWSDGTLTNLGVIEGGDDFIASSINDAGQVVGRYTTASDQTSGFFYDPAHGIMDIKACVQVNPETITASSDVRLLKVTNRGTILGWLNDSGHAFQLVPFGGAGPFTAPSGTTLSSALADDGTLSVVAINDAGEIILFQRDPGNGQWTAIDLAQSAGADRATSAVTFRDIRAGRVGYAAATPSALLLISQDDQGNWTIRILSQETGGGPIVRGFVEFTTTENYVTLAGLDAGGHIVIYGETGAHDGQGRVVWAFDDLTMSQLIPRNIATPNFAGSVTAYVTPWNGQNIAGVDSNGDIQVVWTGGDNGGWSATNLSVGTGAPTLTGDLTAYVTSWGGLNLAGADINGDTVVTWWVPGFGGDWRHDNFTQQFGGPRFRVHSLTSYVQPWGGLNVGGLTDDGTVVVYWWEPTESTWRIATLDFNVMRRQDVPVHRLSSSVAPSGATDILTTGSTGDVLRYHWQPGGDWQLDNLTEMTRG